MIDRHNLGHLWPGWIPRSTCSLLVGAPGIGKSIFLLDILRRLLNNEMMPDNLPPNRRGRNFIWVDVAGQLNDHYDRLLCWHAAGQLKAKALMQVFPQRARPGQHLDLREDDYQDTLLHMVDALKPEWVIVDGLAMPSGRHTKEPLAVFSFLNQVAIDYALAVTLTTLQLPEQLKRQAKSIISISQQRPGIFQIDKITSRDIFPKPLIGKFEALASNDDCIQLSYQEDS